jgi:hypothetical protein
MYLTNKYTHWYYNIEQTNNLAEFCKTHKLSLPAMRDQVAKGKQEHHNGYCVKSIPKT